MAIVIEEEGEFHYTIGRVLRQNTEGHVVRLYEVDNAGSWTPTHGYGSKQTITTNFIILVGIQLTKRSQKIRKADLEKIDNILDVENNRLYTVM